MRRGIDDGQRPQAFRNSSNMTARPPCSLSPISTEPSALRRRSVISRTSPPDRSSAATTSTSRASRASPGSPPLGIWSGDELQASDTTTTASAPVRRMAPATCRIRASPTGRSNASSKSSTFTEPSGIRRKNMGACSPSFRMTDSAMACSSATSSRKSEAPDCGTSEPYRSRCLGRPGNLPPGPSSYRHPAIAGRRTTV